MGGADAFNIFVAMPFVIGHVPIMYLLKGYLHLRVLVQLSQTAVPVTHPWGNSYISNCCSLRSNKDTACDRTNVMLMVAAPTSIEGASSTILPHTHRKTGPSRASATNPTNLKVRKAKAARAA